MTTHSFAENNFPGDNISVKKRDEATGKEADINVKINSANRIRFEEKKEQFTWASPEDIIFVKSADHYVKAVIKCGGQKKWMSRHCTIKDLLSALPSGDFIRLNKFYLLNRNCFLRYDQAGKILFLHDDFSVPLDHTISRYILDLFK